MLAELLFISGKAAHLHGETPQDTQWSRRSITRSESELQPLPPFQHTAEQSDTLITGAHPAISFKTGYHHACQPVHRYCAQSPSDSEEALQVR